MELIGFLTRFVAFHETNVRVFPTVTLNLYDDGIFFFRQNDMYAFRITVFVRNVARLRALVFFFFFSFLIALVC